MTWHVPKKYQKGQDGRSPLTPKPLSQEPGNSQQDKPRGHEEADRRPPLGTPSPGQRPIPDRGPHRVPHAAYGLPPIQWERPGHPLPPEPNPQTEPHPGRQTPIERMGHEAGLEHGFVTQPGPHLGWEALPGSHPGQLPGSTQDPAPHAGHGFIPDPRPVQDRHPAPHAHRGWNPGPGHDPLGNHGSRPGYDRPHLGHGSHAEQIPHRGSHPHHDSHSGHGSRPGSTPGPRRWNGSRPGQRPTNDPGRGEPSTHISPRKQESTTAERAFLLDVKQNGAKKSKSTFGRRVGAFLFNGVCFLYLAVVVSIFVLSRYAEAWWPATLVLFSPRSVLWIPLLLLFLSWLALRTRLGLVAIVAAAGFCWPLASINLPVKRWFVAAPATEGEPVHFVTINMHSMNKVPKELDRFLNSTTIEVVAIQNWDASDECFLRFLPGWHVHYSRSHFLASRFPIKSAVDIGDESRGQKGAVYRYELDTPKGPIHVFSLHLATNRDGVQSLIQNEEKGPKLIQDNSDRRLAQSQHIYDQVQSCEGPVVVMGDFNTPIESPHYARVWGGFLNAFEQAGLGWGYTFFGDGTMVRIDHVLASEHWHIESCSIGPKVGSPHRPVVASLVLKQP